jgi:hypothetical protein
MWRAIRKQIFQVTWKTTHYFHIDTLIMFTQRQVYFDKTKLPRTQTTSSILFQCQRMLIINWRLKHRVSSQPWTSCARLQNNSITTLISKLVFLGTTYKCTRLKKSNELRFSTILSVHKWKIVKNVKLFKKYKRNK